MLPGQGEEAPWQVSVGADSGEHDNILVIEGDRMVDRLARQMGWGGIGSLSQPYRAQGLTVDGMTLLFRGVSRAIELHEAELVAPDDAPALVLTNVTGFVITSSVLTAKDAAVIHITGSEWIRIGASTLIGNGDGILAEHTTSLDILENVLRVKGRGIHLRDDGGNHWIEGNRISGPKTGILLTDSTQPSVILDNQVSARTGILASTSAGPLIEGNHIDADEAVVLQDTPDVTLLDNILVARSTAVRADASDGLFAKATEVRGEGSGLRIRHSDLVLIANLTYAGPGPALAAEGGRLLLVANSTLELTGSEGDAVTLERTTDPLLISNQIAGGARNIALSQTIDATIARNTLVGASEAAAELVETRGSLLAENEVAFTPYGIRVRGGDTPQVAANTFDTTTTTGIEVTDAPDALLASNRFQNVMAAKAMHLVRATDVVVEENHVDNALEGLRIEDTAGATVTSNQFDESGLIIRGPAGDARLLLEDNRISGAKRAAVIDSIHGFVMYGNWFLYNDLGLHLQDATGGTVYNNYFDNRGPVNAAATGDLDVIWHVEPYEGRNIAGGTAIGGNWWHDYSGVDSDEDGFGDLPYGVLPYDESASVVLSGATTYGVADEWPLTSNGIDDSPAAATPLPKDLLGPRIDRLKGHNVHIDAILLSLA